MKYRTTTILAEEDQTNAAGTKTIEINVVDIISRIEVKFRAKNVTDDNADHPAANITKIELVDGSDVLYSLNGFEAQSLNFYNRGTMPGVGIDTQALHWNTAFFGLDFGRYLWDSELALDPMKFKNLQLKITYDEAVCNTSATDNYLSVYAFVFDEKIPAPRGFLMTKELIDYTGAQGAYYYVDVPTDYLMKQIYVFARLVDYTFTTQIGEIRLSEDHLKRTVVDLSTSQYYYLTKERYGFTFETAYCDGCTINTACYIAPTDGCSVTLNAYGSVMAAGSWWASADGGHFDYNPTNANYNPKFEIKGIFPHGGCPLLFYNDKDIDDWYDVTTKESIELRIKAGASYSNTGDIQVVTEQLRTYVG